MRSMKVNNSARLLMLNAGSSSLKFAVFQEHATDFQCIQISTAATPDERALWEQLAAKSSFNPRSAA